MIQDLRKYTDSFLFKLLLGFISVTFVISFGMGSFFGDRKEVIARVDETEILQRDFQRMYGQQLESLRQRLGENADQIAQQVNLRQQVFQQLIDRQLLLNMAESPNLRATDLEVQEYIRQQPYFQKNGQFDFETYETLLSQNRLPTEDYEESVRLDLLLQKKQQLLTAGIIISERDVEQRFQLQNESWREHCSSCRRSSGRSGVARSRLNGIIKKILMNSRHCRATVWPTLLWGSTT